MCWKVLHSHSCVHTVWTNKIHYLEWHCVWILQVLLFLNDLLCQITCPEGKNKSFDLNITTSNREYITIVSGRTLCPPYIHDKELLLYWENF